MTTTYEWHGGSGAFNAAAKWKPHGVPGMDDNADFAKGGTINGDGGGVFEVAALSIEANVIFASVNGSYAPTVEALNGLNVSGGKLTLKDGASLSTSLSGVFEGQPPASANIDDGGAVVVSGAELNVSAGGLNVAFNGAASLTINQSGTVTTSSGSTDYAGFSLGVSDGSSGTLSVSGDGVLSITDSGANFGYSGAAKVSVTSGGTIELTGKSGDNAALGLGATSTSSATLNVSGVGSTLLVTDGAVNDGFGGTGTITIGAGGTFDVTTADIGILLGVQNTGTGVLKIDGGTLSDAGELQIGQSGSGTYLQEHKSAVTIGALVDPTVAPAISIGVDSGGVGGATITGTGTTLTVDGQIDAGLSGAGRFTVSSGAHVISGDASGTTDAGVALGVYSGGAGTLVVSGAGSSLVNTGIFVIGGAGAATLTVSAGGSIQTTVASALMVNGANLANNASSTAIVKVTGANSRWTIGSDLVLANSGTGSLTISSNGAVTVGTTLIEGQATGGVGHATIESGGNLSVAGAITLAAGTSSVGTVLVENVNSALDYGGGLNVGGLGAASLTVDAGARVTPTSGGSGVIAISPASGGKGSVTVAGTLSGSSLTIGQATTASVGKASLVIQSGGVVALSAAVGVDHGATVTLAGGLLQAGSLSFLDGGKLSGYGTIQSSVTASAITAAGGSLSITGAVGAGGSVAGTLNLAAGSVLNLGSSVAAHVHVDFNGANTTLDLQEPSLMAGVIADFTGGNTIDLSGVTATSLSYKGSATSGKLTVHQSGGPNVVIAFAGTYTTGAFEMTNTAMGVVITHT